MNVEFTPAGRADLLSIRDWIAADDERASASELDILSVLHARRNYPPI